MGGWTGRQACGRARLCLALPVLHTRRPGHLPPASSLYCCLPAPCTALQYYPLDISFFKSSLDSHLLDLLWNKYWVHSLSSNPLLSTRDLLAGQLADIGGWAGLGLGCAGLGWLGMVLWGVVVWVSLEIRAQRVRRLRGA